MKPSSALVLLALVLAGCANTRAMRRLAGSAATYAGGQGQAANAYILDFQDSAALETARTADYEADAAHERDAVTRLQWYWTAAGQSNRQDRFDAVKGAAAEDIVAAATLAPAATSIAAPAVPPLGYAQTAQLLTGLAAKPSRNERLLAVVRFTESVNSALTEIQKTAKAQKDQSQTTPDATTTTTP